MSGTDGFGFAVVDWLPPFRLEPQLLDDPLEVALPPGALQPFARLRADRATLRVSPEAPDEAVALAAAEDPQRLRALLSAVPAGDLSVPSRARRWVLGTALAAAEATAALGTLGGIEGWRRAAAARRAWYLRALDAGSPPAAEAVASACRQVPWALTRLGDALPTEEAVRLLAPLGRIVEVGAGFGLFARALERAGMAVAASDADASPATGIAFPVRRGWDALATLEFFEAEPGPPPPVLLAWPRMDHGDWFAAVFARARPGQVIAMASPEVEFCALGGLDAAAPPGSRARDGAAPGWAAAAALAVRLGREFEALGEAPVAAAGWPEATTPLRLWRRR